MAVKDTVTEKGSYRTSVPVEIDTYRGEVRTTPHVWSLLLYQKLILDPDGFGERMNNEPLTTDLITYKEFQESGYTSSTVIPILGSKLRFSTLKKIFNETTDFWNGTLAQNLKSKFKAAERITDYRKK
jgi:hypothetical protein